MTITTTSLKKYFKPSLILTVSVLCLSMTSIDNYELLSPEDQKMEIIDQDGPSALSSAADADPFWESFNTWQCFSTESVQPECSELDYGAIKVPTLRLTDGTTMLDFSLDPEPDLDCEQTLAKWVALLENQRSFCVYAAFLQNYPDNPFRSQGVTQWQLWIVNQIKTRNGYWHWNGSDSEPSSTDESE